MSPGMEKFSLSADEVSRQDIQVIGKQEFGAFPSGE